MTADTPITVATPFATPQITQLVLTPAAILNATVMPCAADGHVLGNPSLVKHCRNLTAAKNPTIKTMLDSVFAMCSELPAAVGKTLTQIVVNAPDPLPGQPPIRVLGFVTGKPPVVLIADLMAAISPLLADGKTANPQYNASQAAVYEVVISTCLGLAV